MAKRTQDHFTRAAKAQGYPARSVFKLQAIQEKFRVAASGQSILDLGAAPGSWTRYVAGIVGSSGAVVAIDLAPIGVSGSNIVTLQGDFTDASVVADIAARGPFHCVLSDAAPATTGNRIVDTARSSALVESVFYNLPSWLRVGGNVVVKVFQGGDERALLDELRRGFESAKAYRPKAVRSESFETYLVGLGYRGGVA